jgi:predicted transcriptional regulator
VVKVPRRSETGEAPGSQGAKSEFIDPMELDLPRELEGRLAAAARRRGLSVEALAREALERAADYDDWFLREVESGLAQINSGQVLTHVAVGSRLTKKLAERDVAR